MCVVMGWRGGAAVSVSVCEGWAVQCWLCVSSGRLPARNVRCALISPYSPSFGKVAKRARLASLALGYTYHPGGPTNHSASSDDWGGSVCVWRIGERALARYKVAFVRVCGTHWVAERSVSVSSDVRCCRFLQRHTMCDRAGARDYNVYLTHK